MGCANVCFLIGISVKETRNTKFTGFMLIQDIKQLQNGRTGWLNGRSRRCLFFACLVFALLLFLLTCPIIYAKQNGAKERVMVLTACGGF